MISSRCTNVSPPAVMIRPPLGLPTKAATARSISPASRTSIGFNSTPNDGATAWMAPSWPLPEACLESRNTATRVRPGAISLSSSNHFPLMPYSVKLNPVALPPGRAKLSTKPPPTGSPTFTNTIGTARVASSKGGKLGLPVARMTSGASAISSAAYLRTSSVLVGQRVSMRTLWPSIQPNFSSPPRNAAMRALPSASSAAVLISTPMRRIRSFCARAASGHAAAPPTSRMDSRPLIVAPRGQNHAPHRLTAVRVLERGETDASCDQLCWAGNIGSCPHDGGQNRKNSESANVFRFAPERESPICALMRYEVARPASPTQELGWRASAWRGRLWFVTPLANKDKGEYRHRCDQQDGEHDGPNQRRQRSRLFVMFCHRRYPPRQLLANAAIAASR